MKNVMLHILGFIVAVLAWVVGFLVVYWGIVLLARIPFLGWLLYWPADVGVAVRLLPLISGAEFATLASCKICGDAKLVGIALVALNVVALAGMIMAHTLNLPAFVDLAVGFACGVVAWSCDD